MNIKLGLGLGLAALLLLVQMINGYVLNMTKLYTPGFTYWLIAGIVIAGWITIAICCAKIGN